MKDIVLIDKQTLDAIYNRLEELNEGGNLSVSRDEEVIIRNFLSEFEGTDEELDKGIGIKKKQETIVMDMIELLDSLMNEETDTLRQELTLEVEKRKEVERELKDLKEYQSDFAQREADLLGKLNETKRILEEEKQLVSDKVVQLNVALDRLTQRDNQIINQQKLLQTKGDALQRSQSEIIQLKKALTAKEDKIWHLEEELKDTTDKSPKEDNSSTGKFRNFITFLYLWFFFHEECATWQSFFASKGNNLEEVITELWDYSDERALNITTTASRVFNHFNKEIT